MRPRIRTLKPEIWEDEAVGRLGVWERLLYVGLITMADDEGRLRALPGAIAGHVFPYDDLPPVKIKRWLETINTAELVVLYHRSGTDYVEIQNWSKHQRISRPVESPLPPPPDKPTEPYKKRAIPEATRRAVAKAAGAIPGETVAAVCHYCGTDGSIHWPRISSGRAGSWITFDGLELDHVIPEFDGGGSDPGNVVLACRKCNRQKGHRQGPEYAPVHHLPGVRTG